jgi:hypothetical protein
MPSIEGRRLRGSVGINLRSSPFCRSERSELCHAIVYPPQVMNHLSEGMRLATLHHTKMARELVTLQAAVSSAVESMLGRSPNEIFHMEVEGELVVKF